MINKLTDNIIRQPILSETETSTDQIQQQPTTVGQVQEYVSKKAADYASAVIAERRISGNAQQYLLRNKLEAELTKQPETTSSPEEESQTPIEGGVPQASAAGPATAIQNELALGSTGPEVKILQTEMNKWLQARGFDPIPESEMNSAYFGPKTQEVVLLFQDNHVLKQDGIVGGNTRDMLALENNENFQKLDFNTQFLVKNQMASYEGTKEPQKREKLLNLATDPNFFDCQSPRTRQAILNRVEIGVESEADLHGYLQLRADMAKDETFQNLSAEMQDRIDMKMEQTHGFAQQAKIQDLATEPNFGKLSEKNQNMALDTVVDINRFGYDSFDPFMRIIRNASMPGLQEDVQSRILDSARRNEENKTAVESLNQLISNPLFSILSRDQQLSALNTYLLMFPGQDFDK
jgi:Putative peptidoglycan binding domain